MAATPSSSSTTSASAVERLQREYGSTVAAVEPGGADVPGDISVVGYDDSRPPPTTRRGLATALIADGTSHERLTCRHCAHRWRHGRRAARPPARRTGSATGARAGRGVLVARGVRCWAGGSSR